MSIGGIGGNPSIFHGNKRDTTAASGSAAASDATASIANTGSVTSGNMDSFFKSFSADLQSTLNQTGNSQSTTQTAANQPLAGGHHHHHHHPGAGDGSMQGVANQMTSQVGQGPLRTGGISNSANVMQALQAYSATASEA
jgi:hypothetical protein